MSVGEDVASDFEESIEGPIINMCRNGSGREDHNSPISDDIRKTQETGVGDLPIRILTPGEDELVDTSVMGGTPVANGDICYEKIRHYESYKGIYTCLTSTLSQGELRPPSSINTQRRYSVSCESFRIDFDGIDIKELKQYLPATSRSLTNIDKNVCTDSKWNHVNKHAHAHPCQQMEPIEVIVSNDVETEPEYNEMFDDDVT